jgi:hypothetical protein
MAWPTGGKRTDPALWILNPDLAIRFFLKCPFFTLLLFPLVITILPHCHFFLLHNDERTVTLLFLRHDHLLLTITNFLPFASFLLLLTLDRLQRWRRR